VVVNPRERLLVYMAASWCDMRAHLRFLRDIARGQILEIGVRQGASTSVFLTGLESADGHLYSVDIEASCAKLFPGHPKWSYLHRDSRDRDWILHRIPSQLDVLFIDGNHSYRAVCSDLVNYSPLVRTGGLILMHDIFGPDDQPSRRPHPGVWRAVSEFLGGPARHNYKLTIHRRSYGLAELRKMKSSDIDPGRNKWLNSRTGAAQRPTHGLMARRSVIRFLPAVRG
jgi:predicted O-methyltransferase YrrM